MDSSGGDGSPLQLLTLCFSTQEGLLFTARRWQAWFSTGLICHPVKKCWYTEWESVSLLCSSKAGGKIRGRRKTGRYGEKEGAYEEHVCETKGTKDGSQTWLHSIFPELGENVKTGNIVCVRLCVCVCMMSLLSFSCLLCYSTACLLL